MAWDQWKHGKDWDGPRRWTPRHQAIVCALLSGQRETEIAREFGTNKHVISRLARCKKARRMIVMFGAQLAVKLVDDCVERLTGRRARRRGAVCPACVRRVPRTGRGGG